MVGYTPGGSPIFGGFPLDEEDDCQRKPKNRIVKCPHGCGASMPANNVKRHKCRTPKPEPKNDPFHPRNL